MGPVNVFSFIQLSNFRIEYYEVSFQTDGDVYLDNIQVYNFVQDGQLRDIDGNELSCMGAIRALNAALN